MPNHQDSHPEQDAVVAEEIGRLLQSTPAFQKLDPDTQAALSQSMTKVAGYLARGEGDDPSQPIARQLAPDLSRLRRSGQQPRGRTPPPGQAAAPGQPQRQTQPGAARGGGTVGRVGEVTRATLNAIDFPGFVGSLIQGTFQAIVDASIQQMEAYAELLASVAKTVDEFMAENVTDGMARDSLADQYGDIFQRDTRSGTPRLTVDPSTVQPGELPSFLKDLGFDSPADIDEQTLDEVVVPDTRRRMAEMRHQTLATMVMMGINRVVVDDGEILAKLQFHIDASETTELRFDQTKTTVGNISGTAGRSPFTANAVLVNTTSLNAQTDINLRTDLTGQVRVRFRSETFPLERFADSGAIQLINSRAKVPQPAPAAVPGEAAAPAVPGAPVPGAAPVAAAPAAPAPAAQAAEAAATPAGRAQGQGSGPEDADENPWTPRTES